MDKLKHNIDFWIMHGYRDFIEYHDLKSLCHYFVDVELGNYLHKITGSIFFCRLILNKNTNA